MRYSTVTYRVVVLAFGLYILGNLLFVDPPYDRTDNVHESAKTSVPSLLGLRFRESAREFGLRYLPKESSPWPALSIVDINKDGYMDVYLTVGGREPNRLYINQRGRGFVEQADLYGIGRVNEQYPSAYALWGDFNGDGREDLLLAKRGCHQLFLRTGPFAFKDSSELLNGYCSDPDAVNTGHFYGSESLDLIFGNILQLAGAKKADTSLWMQSTRYDDHSGGEDHLLRNQNGRFILEKRANFLKGSFTHSVGLSDIDNDGLPDVFFANDYAFDQMFLNKGEGVFSDVTDQYIPKVLHGMSGMNGEFFDVFNTGFMDLYVTNIYKPPFYRAFNLLWKKGEDGRFRNVSTEVGVARCGFSWAAKFADFNNDGYTDLYVVNGRYRDSRLRPLERGRSLWYERIEVSQIPLFLRDLYKGNSMRGRQISAFEQKCLFAQHQGQFYDMAQEAGIDNRDEERGMALVDIDNDGKIDILSSGPSSTIKFFHNESRLQSDSHWLGLILKNRLGSEIPHGAKVFLVKKNGQRIMREFYPANGYKAASDPRIHFGLGVHSDVSHVEIIWPTQKDAQKYYNLKLNQYNFLAERVDEKSYTASN